MISEDSTTVNTDASSKLWGSFTNYLPPAPKNPFKFGNNNKMIFVKSKRKIYVYWERLTVLDRIFQVRRLILYVVVYFIMQYVHLSSKCFDFVISRSSKLIKNHEATIFRPPPPPPHWSPQFRWWADGGTMIDGFIKK